MFARESCAARGRFSAGARRWSDRQIVKVLAGCLLVLFLALQYRLWFGEGSVQEVSRLREETRATRAELLRLQSRNQALEAEVADLKSGLEAIEERARAELGMIDGDETFYQFVRERAAEKLGAGMSPE